MIINFSNIGGSSINSGAVQEQIDQSIVVLVASADYISSAHTINFYNESGTTLSTIDATDFIKDGMVNNVYVSGSNLVITFNTDSGKEDIEIPLTSIFPADNYYTKTEIDNKNYVNSGQVETQISSKGFITSADTQGFASESEVSALTATLEEGQLATSIALNNLNNRVNEISGNTGGITSADVETQILSKNYITSADTIPNADVANKVGAGSHLWTGEAIGDEFERLDINKLDVTASTEFLTSADTQDFLTSADTQGFLTSADTQNFATITEVSGLTAHIEESEEIISTSLNDLNTRLAALEAIISGMTS